MAEWVKPEYRKGQVDAAGKFLIPWWQDPEAETTEELIHAYEIVQNWRTSHGLPLNVFQAVLRGRAAKLTTPSVIAQRLKRFSSVMDKLVREPNMKLSQMQDLGGCRAIVSNVKDVYRLREMYLGMEPLFEGQSNVKCRDYIRRPKEDGYRSIHIIGRYHPRNKDRKAWEGSRIEIQLRSKLQHFFATAVETVTTFTGAPLKFGYGPANWRRFFSLMGSAFAVREGTELVPGTSREEKILREELSALAKSLRVRHRLKGWTNALTQLPRRNTSDFKWLLLALDTTENTIKVSGYANRKEADKAISEIEKSRKKNVDAVLVWVRSIAQLRAAYPNYYADTREFLKALDFALKK